MTIRYDLLRALPASRESRLSNNLIFTRLLLYGAVHIKDVRTKLQTLTPLLVNKMSELPKYHWRENIHNFTCYNRYGPAALLKYRQEI